MSSHQRRNIALIGAVYFLIFISVPSTNSFINLYFDELGLSGRQIGLLASIAPAVTLLAQGFWAQLSDRRLGVKNALAFTVFGSLAVSLLFPHAQLFLLLMLLQVIAGFFQGAVIPLTNTATMAVISEVNAGSSKPSISYAQLRMFGSIGFTVATFSLGLFLEATQVVNVFYWKATGLLAALAVTLTLAMPVKRQKKDAQTRKGSFVKFLRSPSLAVALGAFFLVFLALSLGNTFLGLHIEDIGGKESDVGLAFTIMSFSAFPMYLVVDRIRKFIGFYPVMILASFGFLLRWVFTLVAPTPLFVFLAQPFHGLPFVLMYTGIVNYVYNTAPDDLKASSMGLLAALQATTRVLGSLLGGVLYEAFGGRAVFSASSISVLMALAVLFLGRQHLAREIGRPLRRAWGRTARRLSAGS